MHLLVVEDDIDIASNLKLFLEANDFQVTLAHSIKQVENLENKKYDLVVLDVLLPDGNGIDFYLKDLKNDNIPVIFLTACDEEEKIVLALEKGAEDYVTKPFSSRELLTRIKKIILRTKKSNIINVKDLVFDIDKMTVYKNNHELKLTNLELKILSLLLFNINKVVTREQIIENIWNWTGNDVNDNTVTVYLKRIREKIGENIIVTLKGIGYRIDEK